MRSPTEGLLHVLKAMCAGAGPLTHAAVSRNLSKLVLCLLESQILRKLAF